MKAVILAGGFGTRLSEETAVRPKPMVEIGGRPIIWHIMKIYAAHGIKDFVVCLGYMGHSIKDYFLNYHRRAADFTIDLTTNDLTLHNNGAEDWRVTLVDTGQKTMTGGRLKRVLPYVKDDDAFLMTYGDGVADIDIKALIAFHRAHGKLATVTGTQPPGRFGALITEGDIVTAFREKPDGEGGWINGGYFVLSPKVGELIEGNATIWEREPMEKLAMQKQLAVYRHSGFWQPMDTLRDKQYLEELWARGKAPWYMW
jgi:glucose-1-phosphate cytidylyltransferase